jgi:hypothetical protein
VGTEGKSGKGMKLTTFIHLMLKLRMGRVILLLPSCAFVSCTGTLPFTFVCSSDVLSGILVTEVSEVQPINPVLV